MLKAGKRKKTSSESSVEDKGDFALLPKIDGDSSLQKKRKTVIEEKDGVLSPVSASDDSDNDLLSLKDESDVVLPKLFNDIKLSFYWTAIKTC